MCGTVYCCAETICIELLVCSSRLDACCYVRYGTRQLVCVHLLALGCVNMKHLLLLVIFSAYAAMDNALLLKCYKHEPCAYFLCAVRVSYV